MRILLVEDEPSAAHVLAKGLREQSYAVDVAGDGDAAIFQAGTTDYDAVILDVMLPHKNGFVVCRTIREAGCAVPILMVTARDAVEARIEGLDCGADDYLVKPFDFGELLARLRALVRRGRQPILPERLTVGPLTIDTRSRRVSLRQREVSLTAKEYAFLEYLARRAGDVVSRADIAEHVWDEHYDPLSNVVDVYVQRLRRKLDRTGGDSMIRTRRGEGYQLVAGAARDHEEIMKTLSLRARLTLWYTLALLLVLSLFGADVLWQQRRIGTRRVDRDLEAFADTFANVVRDELSETTDPVAAAEEARTTLTSPGRAIAILDAHGRPLAARWNGLELPAPLPAKDDGPKVWTATTASGAWRVHARPQSFDAASHTTADMVLLVASPLSDVLREQREVQEAMVVGIPIVLLLAAGGGLWLASFGLRPITDMAQRAARIAPSGLEDLGQSERTDELGQLASAFNGLVARLRAALQTQRQFMADASHELRTPVSVVRTAAEVTLSRDARDDGEYREALTIVGGQARRLGSLVEDMLVLARADAGGYPLRPVDLYLDEVVADCRRAADVLATERGVTIRAENAPEMPFRGDEDLLRQLVTNVLQNAVQHTPSGGTVTVTMCRDSGAVRIRIADEGSGIPPGDQARVFDRFVQLDPARRAQGTGLGLPIARWIAEAHGGTLALEQSGPGGSTFCITLPMSTND